jgi:hypothetical protein
MLDERRPNYVNTEEEQSAFTHHLGELENPPLNVNINISCAVCTVCALLPVSLLSQV